MKSAGNRVVDFARLIDRTILQRLAKHLERAAVEFGQLVEKKHAVVGE
jgi:hypothetical protein